MKIRFYTNNKEAIVFDLEDILKQLNIEEQVATVGLVIEKDEAEVEAIAQTIQDDYPNMYLQAKEYGRNLTLACAELPNPTNPDILTPPTIEIVGFLGGAARFIAKPCLKQRVMWFPIIHYGCSA